jgi:hypothetical protein
VLASKDDHHDTRKTANVKISDQENLSSFTCHFTAALLMSVCQASQVVRICKHIICMFMRVISVFICTTIINWLHIVTTRLIPNRKLSQFCGNMKPVEMMQWFSQSSSWIPSSFSVSSQQLYSNTVDCPTNYQTIKPNLKHYLINLVKHQIYTESRFSLSIIPFHSTIS